MSLHDAFLLLLLVSGCQPATLQDQVRVGDLEILHSWSQLEFHWPSAAKRQEAIQSGEFVPENNILGSVKLYNGTQFATVQRWRLGVPSVLNTVVEMGGSSLLQPYPNWDMQKVGNCSALQFALAMEADPNTGYLWVLDAGRINIFGAQPQNLCPAKLIVFDTNTDQEVLRYEFPADVVDPSSNFLNDIILDYVDGSAKFAYITDTLNYKIIVFDVEKMSSFYIHHPESMNPEPNAGNITINGDTVSVPVVGINGITMSSDFRYVYYGPVAGYSLYQVPTYILRKQYDVKTYGKEVRKVGTRVSQGDGILLSSTGNMYYSALPRNSVYKWALSSDAQVVGLDRVTMKTQAVVATDNERMRWVDTLTLASDGFLYFTSTSAAQFLLGKLDYSGATGPNFRIGRIYVGEDEESYLNAAATGHQPRYGEPEIMYAWNVPKYTSTYPSYIADRNLITGIKVFRDQVYVNSPNWRPGAASSLNLVVERNGESLLEPFPSLAMHELGNCTAIQYSQSMEIDPNTGWMWIVDTGRTNLFPDKLETNPEYTQPINRCPAKIIIYDLLKKEEVRRYVFPPEVVDPTKTFLNDIVIDYVNGTARYAYITDTLDHKLVVYDYNKTLSYFYRDDSMMPESGAGNITVNNETVDLQQIGINGIALTEDFQSVYYAPVAGYGLYRVSTDVLRNQVTSERFSRSVEKVVDRKFQSDGMVATMGGNIYYSALPDNALYRSAPASGVLWETLVARSDASMQWIDTLAMDEQGYIWFTAPAVQLFLNDKMDFTGDQGPNYYIWRVYVNDRSYLYAAEAITKPIPVSAGSQVSFTAGVVVLSSLVCKYVNSFLL